MDTSTSSTFFEPNFCNVLWRQVLRGGALFRCCSRDRMRRLLPCIPWQIKAQDSSGFRFQTKVDVKNVVLKSSQTYFHTIHGILTYICLIFMVNVGKYTSPMDGMGFTYLKQPATLIKKIWTNYELLARRNRPLLECAHFAHQWMIVVGIKLQNSSFNPVDQT